jgi:hypothetical protein
VKAWTVEDMRRTITEFAGMEWTAWDEAFWTPERIRSCQAHFERDFAADIERWERRDRHWWPLAYYKQHGIEPGHQEEVLTALAARYARDLSVSQLADQLFEVMQACDQRPRDPWKNRHAYMMAARAHRFIERADLDEAAWMPGLMAWCERANRQAASLPRNRQPRVPGTRNRRKPGRAA